MNAKLSDIGIPSLNADVGPHRLCIRPVHTRVPGRSRFKVTRLHRSRGMKHHLESRLSGTDGIRSVEANVLTGNLLVLHTPGKSVADIARFICKQLDFEPPVAAARSTKGLRAPNVGCGANVALESDKSPRFNVMLTPLNSPSVAFLIPPSLVFVPLGFLRTFSIGLFHASPILIFLLLMIILMGQIVGKKEGWSKADALYFSLITATTVGYGDFRPTKRWSKVLAVTTGFTGLVFTGIVTAIGLHSAQRAFTDVRPAGVAS